MKADKAKIEAALRAPATVRLFLFYGPDEAGSRSLAKRLGEAMGAGAERIDIAPGDLRADPARLADEAAAISMFGGERYILVEQAGEESLAAVEALLDLPVAGNPVAVIAGALRPTSKLLKAVLASPDALAFASYAPEARDAGRLVSEVARPLGLTVQAEAARSIFDASGGNRAIMARELEKYALYLGADPAQPKSLHEEAIAEVGAANDEGDLSRFVTAVASGNLQLLETELGRLASERIEGVVLVRALARRLLLLARLRAPIDEGRSAGSVMASEGKSLFWKEKDEVAAQLGRWSSPSLARAIERLGEAERQLKTSGWLGNAAVAEEMFALARQAARMRNA